MVTETRVRKMRESTTGKVIIPFVRGAVKHPKQM